MDTSVMQVPFNFDTKYGNFSDALYINEDDNYNNEEIEVLKKERLKNWLHSILNTTDSFYCGLVKIKPELILAGCNAANVTQSDIFFDLGSGSGDVLVQISKQFECNCVGVELNEEYVSITKDKIIQEKLTNKINILNQDIRNTDMSSATVIYSYLVPSTNKDLQPILQNLKTGVRFISPYNVFDNWEPTQTIMVNNQSIHIWIVGK